MVLPLDDLSGGRFRLGLGLHRLHFLEDLLEVQAQTLRRQWRHLHPGLDRLRLIH